MASKKIAIIAFGMEHCRRGVETHARMLFQRLSQHKDAEVFLIKGSGVSCTYEIVLSVPKRDTWLNRFLGKIRGYNIYWEQVFFMVRLTFHLLRNTYDIIYTQEYVHMVGISRLKRWLAPKTKLIYCEGFTSQGGVRLKHADVLQEVNKVNYDGLKLEAEKLGKPMYLIPHFFDPIWENPEAGWQELKEKVIAFKGNRKAILYVGPTEWPEKNFQVLENAFRELGDEWSMIICGEVPASRAKAIDPVGTRLLNLYLHHSLMQVIYPLADIFILPSLDEPFGIATLEAMSLGLPVLLHNNAHSIWLCGDREQCVDMREWKHIVEVLMDKDTMHKMEQEKSVRNQQHFSENYTWEKLELDYLKLFDLDE